jgi:hypothetical protein
MDDIFANAKSILVIWIDDIDPEKLSTFQEILQEKAKQASIAFENAQMLLECKFDLSIDKKKMIEFFHQNKKLDVHHHHVILSYSILLIKKIHQ